MMGLTLAVVCTFNDWMSVCIYLQKSGEIFSSSVAPSRGRRILYKYKSALSELKFLQNRILNTIDWVHRHKEHAKKFVFYG
jgi:hypothetical protein